MKHYYQRPKKWFIERIGKRIYRDRTSCSCKHCEETYRNGLVITDENHAYYVFDCHNEMGIKYYDEPVNGHQAQTKEGGE